MQCQFQAWHKCRFANTIFLPCVAVEDYVNHSAQLLKIKLIILYSDKDATFSKTMHRICSNNPKITVVAK